MRLSKFSLRISQFRHGFLQDLSFALVEVEEDFDLSPKRGEGDADHRLVASFVFLR